MDRAIDASQMAPPYHGSLIGMLFGLSPDRCDDIARLNLGQKKGHQRGLHKRRIVH